MGRSTTFHTSWLRRLSGRPGTRRPKGQARSKEDWALGILYASDVEAGGKALGSIATVMGKGLATVWRFGDGEGEGDDVDLGSGRMFVP